MTSDDALADLCTGTYNVEYYSDATYTTLVGKEICLVCNRQVGRSGVRSSYRKYLMPFQLCP